MKWRFRSHAEAETSDLRFRVSVSNAATRSVLPPSSAMASLRAMARANACLSPRRGVYAANSAEDDPAVRTFYQEATVALAQWARICGTFRDRASAAAVPYRSINHEPPLGVSVRSGGADEPGQVVVQARDSAENVSPWEQSAAFSTPAESRRARSTDTGAPTASASVKAMGTASSSEEGERVIQQRWVGLLKSRVTPSVHSRPTSSWACRSPRPFNGRSSSVPSHRRFLTATP